MSSIAFYFVKQKSTENEDFQCLNATEFFSTLLLFNLRGQIKKNYNHNKTTYSYSNVYTLIVLFLNCTFTDIDLS